MAVEATTDYILPRTTTWVKQLTGRVAYLLLYSLAVTPLLFMLLEILLGYGTFGDWLRDWGLSWMYLFFGLLMLLSLGMALRLQRVIGLEARAPLPILSIELSECRKHLIDTRPTDLDDPQRGLRLFFYAVFFVGLLLIVPATLDLLFIYLSIDMSVLSLLPDLSLSQIGIPSGSGVGIGSLIAAAFVLAARFVWRVKARSVDDSITAARGALVTYLRSFVDDEELGQENADDAFTQRMGIGFATSNSTFEGYALRTVRGARYVVTIADPKKHFPLLFSNVVYARNDEWQDKALRLIQSSEFVILTLSVSSGLDWEVEQLIKGDHLQKTVFILPPTTQDVRNARWSHFLKICRKQGMSHLPSEDVAIDALTVSFPSDIPPFVVRGPHDEFLAYDEAIVASLALIRHQLSSGREYLPA